MYWLAGGFVFRRVVSPFHRLDPRVRLLISMEFFALSLISRRPSRRYVVVVVAILAVAALARSLRRIGEDGGLLGRLRGLHLRRSTCSSGSGLLDAILYSFRFLAIISSTSIFFVTTSPDELEQIMKWMRVPRDVVFAFVTAVRFIPVVMLDAFQIMDAQKSRGLEFEKGSLAQAGQEHGPDPHPARRQLGRSGAGSWPRRWSRGPTARRRRPTSLYGMRLRWYDVAVVAGEPASCSPPRHSISTTTFPSGSEESMILPRVIVDERERQSGVPEQLSKLDVRVYYSRLTGRRLRDQPGDRGRDASPSPTSSRRSTTGGSSPRRPPSRAPTGSPTSSWRGTSTRWAGMVKNLASYYGAIASVTLAYDLRLMHTANADETALAIAALVKNSRAKPVPPGLLQAPPEGQGRGPAAALLRLSPARRGDEAREEDARALRHPEERRLADGEPSSQ